MKRVFWGVISVCCVSIYLNAQDPTTAPASQQANQPAAGTAATSIAKYNIAMKYQPGVKYEVIMNFLETTPNSSDPDDQSKLATNTEEVRLYLDVQNPADDGTVAAKMTIGRIIHAQKVGKRFMEFFDTNKARTLTGKGNSREMLAVFKPKYTVHFDKDGRVVKIDGLDDVVEALSQGWAQMDDDRLAERKKETDQIFFDVIKSFFAPPVAYANCQFNQVGDSCNLTIPTSQPCSYMMRYYGFRETSTLKLESLDQSASGKLATISLSGTLEDDNKTTQNHSGRMRYNLETKTLESLSLDISPEGRPAGTTTKTEYKITIVDKIPVSTATSKPAESQPANGRTDSQKD